MRLDPYRWWRTAAWLLLVAFTINVAVGIWPFAPVEGDELGVLNGIRELDRDQPDARWMYFYPLHAGSHHLIRFMVSLGVPSPLNAFGIATVAAGLACFLFASFIAMRLTGVPFVGAALWLAAVPELSTACFYLNTSVMGGAFAWAALAVATTRVTAARAVGVGLLLAVAGWMRIDALGLAPLVAVLWWRFDRRAVWRGLIIAGTTAIVSLQLLWLSHGIRAQDIIDIWVNRTATRSTGQALRVALLAVGPVMLLAAVGGLMRAMRHRDVWWLVFAVVALVPTVVAHGRFLTTPKYLFLALPVVAMVALSGIRETLRSPARSVRYVGIVVLAALTLDWFTAVRSWPVQRQRFAPDVPLATLVSDRVGEIDVTWVIGGGELALTDDGWRMRGGYWYAPARWRRDKVGVRASLAQLAAFTHEHRDFGVVTCGWVARQAVASTLLADGFIAGPALLHSPVELSNYVQDWRAPDGRVCTHVAIGVFGVDILPALLSRIAGRSALFVTDQGWTPDAASWTPLPGNNSANAVLTLFRSRLSPIVLYLTP